MPLFRLEGDELVIAQETNLELESHLEDWLENSPVALVQDELILWIGRQTSATVEDGTIFPDLLGVDAEGNLVIVELKRDQAPREVVAQLLDYAAWASDLSETQIHEIAADYFQRSDECQERSFEDAFKNMFDIDETDELPPLNRKLRLFIVAREIQVQLSRICRFLRTSYSMDISCVAVSKFQTESGDEIIISMETKVGEEDSPFSTPLVTDYPSLREVVPEVVQKLTGEVTNVQFTPKEVKKCILERYPDFKVAAVNFNIRIYTANQSVFDQIPIEERRYWRIKWGTYRLYDPEKDKVEGDGEVNQ